MSTYDNKKMEQLNKDDAVTIEGKVIFYYFCFCFSSIPKDFLHKYLYSPLIMVKVFRQCSKDNVYPNQFNANPSMVMVER